MVETFFSWPIFSDIVLPFVLVFTLLFTILEKTAVLGKNKQNHAIISLATALILIASPARIVIRDLVPFFAIFAVVLLIFMLLWAFVLQKEKVELPGFMQTILLVLIIASVVVAVMVATSFWDRMYNFLKTEQGVLINLIILVVIIAAAFVVVKYSNSGKSS
jgi:hypothetical protein